MAWGTVTVGGIALRETVVADSGPETVKIVGQEMFPISSLAFVEATHHNIRALAGLTVPVVFTDKTELTGFYLVTDGQSRFERRQQGAYEKSDWSLTLQSVGSGRDVEVESRVPTIARTTTVASPPAAVFWHAPSAGATSYWTGSTVPSVATRQSADGPLPVYLGIPSGVSPRWTCPAESYQLGAARLLFDGIRRVGTWTPPSVGWQVDNGLARVTPGASGAVTVSCWDAGVWASAKDYAFTVNGVALTTTPEFTVLRNTPEEVAVRLSYATLPGRVTVDLSLRRGARFVTGVMKRHSSATLGVARTAAEAASVVTGGLRASAADADGNRFVMGSAATVTTATGTAALSQASVLQLDFFLGHEVATSPMIDEVQSVAFGGTPVAGTFTLTFGGQTTGPIAYNASAATVQSALAALSTIGTGNVTVTGGPGPAAYTVTFAGALAGADVAQMTASGASLSGPAKVSTATTTGGATGTNEVQTVSFGGTVTGGTFTLSFGGQTTSALAWNASAATVQTALQALSTIGSGNIAVTGGPGPATYTLTFQGALRSTDVAQVTGNGAALTGTAPTLSTATTTPGVPGTSEVQSITFDATVNGGTFTLTFGGQTTTAIAYNATAATVDAAVEALSTIGVGNVIVAGGPGPTAYSVTFTGTLRDTNVAQMTATGTALTAGSTPTIAVSTTTQGAGPQSGDAFADLWQQYRGSSGELARIVVR